MSVIGGLIVLVVVLVAASAAGFGLRARQGRFRPQQQASSTPVPGEAGQLTAADLGAPLGQRGTLVQFSTEFCTYCGPTRALLGEVAAAETGVAVVEVDAAE